VNGTVSALAVVFRLTNSSVSVRIDKGLSAQIDIYSEYLTTNPIPTANREP